MAEALQGIADAVQTVAKQTNANPQGPVAPPPKISSLSVVASGGIHRVQIKDNGNVQRGIIYHLEYSTSPQFTTATTFLSHSGPSRDHGLFYGKGPIYWRGFSQYLTGPPSEPVYFGTQTNPTAVDAGGSIVAPTVLSAAGSGTEPSVQPQGAAGFGFADGRNEINRG